MKILMINVVCGIRSTGRICTKLAIELENQGHEVKIAYGREVVPKQFQKYAVRIGTDFDVRVHVLRARFFDACGFGSKNATEKFIRWAEKYNPDILWIHNIHGYYINIEILFNWIKSRPQMEVKWTLHDCWAFTGHCAYFTMENCEKWKSHCFNCPLKKAYPVSFFLDKSYKNFNKKRLLFTGVNKMKLITPSNWLAELTRYSFLNQYPVEIIYNTIDTNVFKPTSSDFRKINNIEDKIVILGIASVWDKRKGLDDFIYLAKLLDDRYVIILVGLSNKQLKKLPKNVIGMGRTNDSVELAKIYSSADFFVNPSREETFGMTTLEAISCGINTIVYEKTACEEIAKDYNGIVVPYGVENIYKAIVGMKPNI